MPPFPPLPLQKLVHVIADIRLLFRHVPITPFPDNFGQQAGKSQLSCQSNMILSAELADDRFLDSIA
jgi:hypothetical protein